MLRTATVTIRDVTYTVQELSGKQMKTFRAIVSDPERKRSLEAWVVWQCCTDPKFGSIEAAEELPAAVLDAVSLKAIKLGSEEQPGEG